MKRFYLLFLLFTSVSYVGAQPIITADIAPSPGDSWPITLLSTIENFSPGPGGLNQTWNFSELNVSGALELEIQIFDQSDLVGGPTFEGVDFVWHLNGFDVYNYYAVNQDSLFQLAGAAFTASSIDIETVFTDPEDGLHFPLEFGDNYDYFSRFDQIVFGIPLGTQERYGNFHADGYGTVITPKGTYQNVLRIINTQVSNGITSVQYAWMDAENFIPILLYEESDDPETEPSVYFSEPQPSSVATTELSSINEYWFAWYEQTAHRIHLNFQDLHLKGASSIQVFTLDGKLLKTIHQVEHQSHTSFSIPVPTDLQTTTVLVSLRNQHSKVSTKMISIIR